MPALDGLTDRERLFVEARLKGMSKTAACAAAGVNKTDATTIDTLPHVARALKAGREQSVKDTQVTRERLVEMFLEAYRSAETATEMVAATRELGRLLGHYEAQKVAVTHELKQVRADQLKTLTVAELERLARGEGVLEGEFFELQDRALITNGQGKT